MQVSVFVVPVFLLLKDNGFFVHVRNMYAKAHTWIRKQMGFTAAIKSAERLRWPADEAHLALCQARGVSSTTNENASEDENFKIEPAPRFLVSWNFSQH